MATKLDKKPVVSVDHSHWPFGKRNYIMFAVAVAVTVLGFILLGAGDITFAPVLLVAGYCVLMPIAIFIRDKSADPESQEPVDSSR
ncbi:MAG: hypothetical protein RBT76_07750 [candidate division Zixibacteria bacterium]|jgi:hypothetical protein|nr:hypothetical protein [candidate division Zixibacteria bacterium]